MRHGCPGTGPRRVGPAGVSDRWPWRRSRRRPVDRCAPGTERSGVRCSLGRGDPLVRRGPLLWPGRGVPGRVADPPGHRAGAGRGLVQVGVHLHGRLGGGRGGARDQGPLRCRPGPPVAGDRRPPRTVVAALPGPLGHHRVRGPRRCRGPSGPGPVGRARRTQPQRSAPVGYPPPGALDRSRRQAALLRRPGHLEPLRDLGRPWRWPRPRPPVGR